MIFGRWRSTNEVTNYQIDHPLVRPNRCKIKPVPNINIYTFEASTINNYIECLCDILTYVMCKNVLPSSFTKCIENCRLPDFVTDYQIRYLGNPSGLPEILPKIDP